jgi:hypothetical protein
MAGLLETVTGAAKRLVGAGTSADERAKLPGGRTVKQWIAESERAKGPGYAADVQTALSYYRGHPDADLAKWLRVHFPKTADQIVPVSVNVVKKIIDEQAQVFVGSPGFTLEQGEVTVEAAGDVSWQSVVENGEAHRKSKEMNRIVKLVKRGFQRTTHDAKRKRLSLRNFTPDLVFPIFAQDSYDLNEAEGVLLEVACGWDKDGRKVRRFEFWCAGETPQNFIIDENDVQTLPPLADGPWPYNDAEGNAVVPIVSFADEDEDAGYWRRPSEQLIGAGRAVCLAWTNIHHVAKLQGFGQWVANPTGENPGQWGGPPPTDALGTGFIRRMGANLAGSEDPQISFGPDTLLTPPKGWVVDHIAQASNLAQLIEAVEAFVRHVTIFESLPAGSATPDARQVASGYALEVERRPLVELREDQVELYRRPMGDQLTTMRIVWNAHQPTNTTRFPDDAVGCFEPDEMRGPVDPKAQADLDEQRIRMG